MRSRIIAKVLIRDGQVVNGYQFDTFRPVGALRYTIKRLQEWQVDEILILNTTHSVKPSLDFLALLDESVLQEINTPISYGGGIHNIAEACKIINLGSERIVLSSKVTSDSDFIRNLRDSVGDQSIVLHHPFTVKSAKESVTQQKYLANIKSNLPINWDGELLLTDVSHDGTYGARLKLLTTLTSSAQPIKTIIGGGFATMEEIALALNEKVFSGVVVGNLFHRIENPIIHLKNNAALNIRPQRIESYL